MVAPPTGGGNESVSYTIKIEIQAAKKALDDIINSEGTLDEKTRRLGTLILEWSKSTGNSISVVTRAFRELAQEGTKDLVKLGGEAAKTQKNLEGLAPAVRGASQGSGGFTSSLSSLGSVAQFVFGSVLGITAVGVLRSISEFFTQATDDAIKFNQQLYQFEVGVRAAQRSGLDVTIAEYNKEIEELQKKYPLFSRQDMYEGYSQVLLLARSLRFTEEQIRQIIDVSATASIIMGRDFGETATGITKSLSSGWFEAAQRAGFLISRQRVVDEGLKMNIENAQRGYNAMTEYERALAALSVYVKENKVIQEDTTLIMETQAGKILAAQAAWENFKLSVGTTLSPLKAIGAEKFTDLLASLVHVAEGWAMIITVLIALRQTLGQLIAYVKMVIDNIADATNVHPIHQFIAGWKILIDVMKDLLNIGIQIIKTIIGIGIVGKQYLANLIPDETLSKASSLFNIFDGLGNLLKQKQTEKGAFAEAFNLQDAWKNALEDAARFTGMTDLLGDVKNLGKQMGEELAEGLEDTNFADAFEKLGYDIEDELIRMADRMKQLWVDLQRKIADILADESRAIAKENAEYARKVESENLSFNRRIAESNAKYRLNEIDAEAKFQEQMRQLRTRFLFDLEDALRERDARQVLRLSRQYQMDKTNAETEFRLEQEARARAHQLELQQIAAEHAERLRVLAEEHAQEIAQIHETAAQRRAEAQLQYEQELEDLKAQTDARLAQKLRDFMREYKLTEAQAKQLVSMLDKYFGKKGQVAQMYNNLAGYILGMIRLIQNSLNALSGIGGTSNNSAPYAPQLEPRYAEGGTLIATRPTRAMFGEAGAEVVTFTPMNQISQHQQNVSQAISSISQSRPAGSPSGMLRLFLGLSPDLRVDIVNDTLQEVSTIVEEVNRTR